MKGIATKYIGLLLTFVAAAVTGIGLHIAGHGVSHEMWHNWAVAHVLSSLGWLISGAIHIKRHRTWYRAVASKGYRSYIDCMRGWRKFRYRPMALCFRPRSDPSFFDSYRLPEASHSEYPQFITVDLLLAS